MKILPNDWAIHISEGTVFNYCKIQARESLENIEGKIKLVFRGDESPYNLQCQKMT
jgi:hypothetical protein